MGLIYKKIKCPKCKQTIYQERWLNHGHFDKKKDGYYNHDCKWKELIEIKKVN